MASAITLLTEATRLLVITSGLLTLASVALYGSAALITWCWLWRQRCRPNVEREWPTISAFKPLHGRDDGLRENLESFARHDYPRLQLLCCAEDAGNAAYQVAEELRADAPESIELYATPCTSFNPKISSLERLVEPSRGELILLSDSNVRLRPGELRELVRPFDDPRVGLVYQPVVGCGETTAAAALENLWLTEQAGFLSIGARFIFGVDGVNGKGMLFRREALEDIGWFTSVREVHNDDYMLGAESRAAGWKLVMQLPAATVVHTVWSWRSSFSRHLRHAAARFRLSPWLYAGELLGNPLVVSLPWAVSMGSRGGWLWLSLLMGKMACEYATSSRLRGRWFHWKYLPLIPLKDLLVLAVWSLGPFCRRVEWRGRRYRIARRTRLEPVPEGRLAGQLAPADEAALASDAPRRSA